MARGVERLPRGESNRRREISRLGLARRFGLLTPVLPLWDMQDRRGPARLTIVLVVSNLIVFAYEAWLGLQAPGLLEQFVQEWALVPAQWARDWSSTDAWRRVGSSMFLHAGLAHVAGNCWFLWVFGRTVESRLGAARFGLLYLAAGVAAAALQVAVEPASRVPMIGASGAISGVLGAYFVLMPKAWVWTLVPWVVPLLPVPAVLFLLLWFALQLTNGLGTLVEGVQTAGGGVAWWAHAGGFVAGVTFAGFTPRRRRRARRRR